MTLHPYFAGHETTPDQLADAVRYALVNGREYSSNIAASLGGTVHPVPDLTGLRVLELGPGLDYGAMLICRMLGAVEAAVLDKYLVEWSDDYHLPFYRQLLELAREELPGCSLEPIERVLAAGRHDPEAVRGIEGDMCAGRTEFADGHFDAVVSNATLEHIADVPALVRELARITAEDRVGIHMVDFRDHSDFERPLEFLTMSDDAFGREFADHRGTRGNRVRHADLVEEFRRGGFGFDRSDAMEFASEDYLADLRPRLASRWRALPEDELKLLAARVFVRRTTATEDQGERLLRPPFAVDSGHCWVVRIEPFERVADSPAGQRSPLLVYEDGRTLGPAHAIHDEIRELGRGRFSHWGTSVYFSTSDNSDPRHNGRRYTFTVRDTV